MGIKLNDHASAFIKKSLKVRKISQEEFAGIYLGVTPRTLQNWFAGRKVSFKNIDIIQDFFCCSIIELYGEIPKEYEETTTSIKHLLAKLLKINIMNSGSRSKFNGGFNYYAQKLRKQVHIRPYPVRESFQILKCNTSNKKRRYYSTISIILENDLIPVDNIFTIGFIMPDTNIRFDYGSIRVKNDLLEVDEVFTSVFSGYRVDLDTKVFKKTKVLFKIATWIGDEDIIFIIRSSTVNFSITSEDTIEKKFLESTGEKGIVIFRKGVWQ